MDAATDSHDPAIPANSPPRRHFAANDLMRVVAMFGVVVIHVSSPVVKNRAAIPAADWWVANIADSASRWCVPLFVMLSGALLLTSGAAEPLSVFYRKRFVRVGIPLVIWTAFYETALVFLGRQSDAGRDVLMDILLCRSFNGQYFLFLIAGLYLFVPFFRVVVGQLGRSEVLFAALLCMLIAVANEWISFVEGGVGQRNALIWFVPYIGYFLAGPFFRQLTVSRRMALSGLAVLVAGITLTAILTERFASRYGPDEGMGLFFYSHFSPLIPIMTAGAFLFLAYPWSGATSLPSRIVAWVSPLTLGIFAIHPAFVLLTQKKFTPWFQWSHPAFGVLLLPPAFYLVSMAIAWLLRRIPGGRYAIG